MRIKPYTRTISTSIGATETSDAENFSFISLVIGITVDTSGSNKQGSVELQVNHGGGYITVGTLYLRVDPTTESIETEVRGQLTAFVPTGASWKTVDTSDVLVNTQIVEATETLF